MEITPNLVCCDGCASTASPDHIAQRVARLELATRFRPIHINLLFIATAPPARPEDDFYGPPESRAFFDSLMDALEISGSGTKAHIGADSQESDIAKLVEFQRRGYYLSYLSECPISMPADTVSSAISRLGATLARRIKFNYRPKHVAILGDQLGPLRDGFEKAGIPSALFPILEMPVAGDSASATRFRAALASAAP